MIESILRNLSYKPNFKFYWKRHKDHYVLSAEITTEDSDNPTQMTKLVATCSFHESETVDRVLLGLTVFLRNFEMHEMEEWLRVNGKRVHNPH